jgi:hypothetical protein
MSFTRFDPQGWSPDASRPSGPLARHLVRRLGRSVFASFILILVPPLFLIGQANLQPPDLYPDARYRPPGWCHDYAFIPEHCMDPATAQAAAQAAAHWRAAQANQHRAQAAVLTHRACVAGRTLLAVVDRDAQQARGALITAVSAEYSSRDATVGESADGDSAPPERPPTLGMWSGSRIVSAAPATDGSNALLVTIHFGWGSPSGTRHDQDYVFRFTTDTGGIDAQDEPSRAILEALATECAQFQRQTTDQRPD